MQLSRRFSSPFFPRNSPSRAGFSASSWGSAVCWPSNWRNCQRERWSSDSTTGQAGWEKSGEAVGEEPWDAVAVRRRACAALDMLHVYGVWWSEISSSCAGGAWSGMLTDEEPTGQSMRALRCANVRLTVDCRSIKCTHMEVFDHPWRCWTIQPGLLLKRFNPIVSQKRIRLLWQECSHAKAAIASAVAGEQSSFHASLASAPRSSCPAGLRKNHIQPVTSLKQFANDQSCTEAQINTVLFFCKQAA